MVDRHIDSKHAGELPGTRRFFCPVQTCKHSKANKEGFPRLDGLKRHVGSAHPGLKKAET